jgi:AraC-like DNA-binding protein
MGLSVMTWNTMAEPRDPKEGEPVPKDSVTDGLGVGTWYLGIRAKTMQKSLVRLYYPCTSEGIVERPLSLLLYGADTAHDPGFIVDRPGPRQDWIILCFRTPFLINTENGLETGQPGDCVVHDADYSEWHTTLPGEAEGFRNDWLHVGIKGMRERTTRLSIPLNRRIPTGFPSFLGEHLQVIADEDRRREAFWQERIGVELEKVLLRIGRARANHSTGLTLSASERLHFERFTVIRSSMLDRFFEPWSVKTLAAMANTSPNRFSVLYSMFFKISPIEELMQHRLKQSCTMLVYSDNTLDAIAEACGFTDASYFSRVFKQRMGCNPGAYRKMGTPRLA